jgi:hypothetical protein
MMMMMMMMMRDSVVKRKNRYNELGDFQLPWWQSLLIATTILQPVHHLSIA